MATAVKTEPLAERRPAPAARRCRAALLSGFAALLLLPGPLWLALRGALDTQNHENRALAPFPAGAAAVPLEDWPGAFDAWLGDHAPFRNQLMSLNARANWALGSLDSSDVLLGKDHWLFLRDVSDSASLSDYQGLTAYTPEQLAACRDTLAALDAALAARGSQLAVLFAPAKEGVYSQYLPDSIPAVRRPTRVQALAESLQEAGLPVVWPQQALIEAAGGQQVYYKYDTHWNEAGACLAAARLLGQLGRDAGPYAHPAVWPDPDTPAPTDLANVSAAWALCTDDVYYRVDAPQAECVFRSEDAGITRWQGGGTGSVLLLRDSFGESLAPYLMAGFGEGLALHGSALAPETILAELEAMPRLPEVVVIEVAERFSNNLFGQAELLLSWAEGL